MFKKFCKAKIEYTLVPFWALAVIPLAFATGILAGLGHAPKAFFIPFLLLFGPLIGVGFLFEKQPLFYFVGPYVLYMLYGFIFVFFSKRHANECELFTKAVVLLHALIALYVIIVKWIP